MAQETLWPFHLRDTTRTTHSPGCPALAAACHPLCPPTHLPDLGPLERAALLKHSLGCSVTIRVRPSQVELLKNKAVPHTSSLSSPPGLLLSSITSSSPRLLSTRARLTLQSPCQGAQSTENQPYKERKSVLANTAP